MSFAVLVYTHISLSIVVSFVRYEIGRQPVSRAAPADFFDDSYSLSYSKQEKNARGAEGRLSPIALSGNGTRSDS